jgi:hypothetical protein
MVCCLVLHGVYVNAVWNGVILYGMVWYGVYGNADGMVCMVMQCGMV